MSENPYDGAEGRPLLDLIIEGMAVVDRDGTPVGTVDKVEGGHVKIVRPDQDPRNQHQYMTPGWIMAVDDRVRINHTIDEAKRLWATEPYAKLHHIQRTI
jgi:hypothetical protein